MLTVQQLNEIKNKTLIEANLGEGCKGMRIVVGMGTCGQAAGATPIYEIFAEAVKQRKLSNVVLAKTGCIGVCRLEPIVEIYIPGKEKVTYVEVTPEKAKRIIAEHLINNQILEEITEVLDLDGQTRISLRNCGIINPESIEEYIAKDGYQALAKAVLEMPPAEVIAEIKNSGLRGRGGAGFPVGRKWEFVFNEKGDEKYIVCNADEGDPGAFMDRNIMEGDPHSIIEAMAIAGYAVGANQGFIYVRAEYPVAVERLKLAIENARQLGLLGENIFGSGFTFDIELRLGAGAFVCGEETALMASIEGKRGEARPKPPYPAVSGLWGKPTTINNVETFANIAPIMLKGPEWFNKIGTENNRGTKVFALGGKINNTGLIEIPMGTTLREVIYKIGGGIPGGKKFKAAQTGGPSGGCIPEEHIDTQIEYDSLTELGSMMGSGGLIIMDEDTCMVDVARFFLEFTVEESCGKCAPCRIGTKRMLEILERLTNNEGQEGDIELLEELAETIKETSLCGLGQTAPNPVLSTLQYFRSEYEAHLYGNKCPAKVCTAFLQYEIDEEKCRKCGLCARSCPSRAIIGRPREIYRIDNSLCIKCGLCISRCPVKAIAKKHIN